MKQIFLLFCISSTFLSTGFAMSTDKIYISNSLELEPDVAIECKSTTKVSLRKKIAKLSENKYLKIPEDKPTLAKDGIWWQWVTISLAGLGFWFSLFGAVFLPLLLYLAAVFYFLAVVASIVGLIKLIKAL